MGTPDFAVPSLRALIDNGYDVVGVFCQPDRPKGRGHKLAACPVKETAEAAGIPVGKTPGQAAEIMRDVLAKANID